MIALFSPGSGRRQARTADRLRAAERRERTLDAACANFQTQIEGLKAERDAAVSAKDAAEQTVAALTAERDRALHGWKAASDEVRRCHALLKPVRDIAATSAPAPAEDPGSCFNQPDPAPIPPGPRIIPDAPEGPVDSEAADVNAETQAVNVRTLREALGVDETQLMPVTWGTEVSATTGKVAQASVRVALESEVA